MSKRKSYEVGYKLKVVDYAEEQMCREAVWRLSLSPDYGATYLRVNRKIPL